MRDDSYTPFKGNNALRSQGPTRVVHRFCKPGHTVEIRERRVLAVPAFEFIVFYDGALMESQLFHGRRLHEYPAALAACCEQFRTSGWVEDPTAPEPARA